MKHLIVADIDGMLMFKEPYPDAIEVEGGKRYVSKKIVELIEQIRKFAYFFLITSSPQEKAFRRAAYIPHDGIVIEQGTRIFYGTTQQEYVVDTTWATKIQKIVDGPLSAFREKVKQERFKVFEEGRKATFKIYIDQPNNVASEQAEEIQKRYKSDEIKLLYNAHRLYALPSLAGKGNAIKQVATHYNIPLQNVFGIGHDTNELGMLKVVGFPLTLQDATPEIIKLVKQAQGYISPCPSHEGAADILTQALKQLKNQGKSDP